MSKKKKTTNGKQESDEIPIPSFELKDLNDKKILSTLLGFINNLPYLIAVLDIKKEGFKTLLINEKMAKSLGTSVENIIGKNIVEFIPTARKKRVKNAKRMIETKKAQFFTDQRKDRFFNNEFYPHIDKHGEVDYGIAIVRDITKQKKEEQKKINQKEAYYESLIENSMDLITVVNKSGIILYTSPSIQHILGYKPRTRIGKKIFEIIHPNDLSSFDNYFHTILSQPKLKRNITFRVKDKQGHWHYFETIINNQIQNSEINGLIINSRDITSRVEQEIEKNAILDNTSEIISYHDLDHNIIWANKAYQQQTGLALDEIKGKKCYHAWGLDQACGKCPISRALKTGKPQEDILSPGNRESWPSNFKTWLIKGDPVLDQDGKVIGAIELSYDITDRQKAEEEIKRTKEQLEKMVNNTKELIFSVNTNYRITLWNQSAENITGLKTTNMLGKDIRKITHFENSKIINNYLKNQFKGNISTIDNIEINTLFGSKRKFDVSASIIKDKQNKVTDIVFICKDITFTDGIYGQLLNGQSYLINDPEMASTLKLYNRVASKNKKGVLITRAQYESVIQELDTKNTSLAILSSTEIPHVKTIENLKSLKTFIKTFVKKEKNSIVCLTRVDYLFTLFGFESVLNTFYEINDIIRKNQAILLLQINKQLLKEKEFQLLSEEYQTLPSKQIKEIYLDDKLIELLIFIYEQKQSNRNVYQKNICNELSISKVTAQKRIDDLIDKELIFSKKQGRTKNIHITEKGKEFLKKQN